MSWVLATLIAAAAQTARNAMQIGLTASLGTIGATQVRFVYGFPFALLFLAGTALVAESPLPSPTLQFLAFTTGGALAQIFGTACLIASMYGRSFSMAIALTKTEPVQVAVFALVLLGERLSAPSLAGIAIATAGVIAVAVRPGDRWDAVSLRPAVLGIASGALFALSAVGFRGGIVALDTGVYFVRATTTLVWSLGIQATLLVLWMSRYRRAVLLRSLAMWRQSLFAGFMGAFASQFWFIGFSLTSAANVRTLALVEVLFAQVVSRRLFAERQTLRELAGLAAMLAGVGLVLAFARGR